MIARERPGHILEGNLLVIEFKHPPISPALFTIMTITLTFIQAQVYLDIFINGLANRAPAFYDLGGITFVIEKPDYFKGF